MKTLLKDGFQFILAILLTSSVAYAVQPQAPLASNSNQVAAETVVKEEKPAEAVSEAPQLVPETKPAEAPKPVQTAPVAAPVQPETPQIDLNARVPVGVHDIGGSGDCRAEIAKYNWTQSVALAVAEAESHHRPGVINNNPGTLDYSVGCFQVNIYGRNAANRPGQAALTNAAINVQWAYNNYVANGSSFIGQWGVCRSEVACY